jgi:hypothetical protein
LSLGYPTLELSSLFAAGDALLPTAHLPNLATALLVAGYLCTQEGELLTSDQKTVGRERAREAVALYTELDSKEPGALVDVLGIARQVLHELEPDEP